MRQLVFEAGVDQHLLLFAFLDEVLLLADLLFHGGDPRKGVIGNFLAASFLVGSNLDQIDQLLFQFFDQVLGVGNARIDGRQLALVGQSHVVFRGIGGKQNPVALCLFFVELALRFKPLLFLTLRLDLFRGLGTFLRPYGEAALADLVVALY